MAEFDIREWCERHSSQLTRIEGKVDYMKSHEKRINDLEHERTRLRTITTVVSAAVTGAWAKLLMVVGAFVALAFLTGCAAVPLEAQNAPVVSVTRPAPDPAREWLDGIYVDVLVSPDLDPECAATNQAAQLLWQTMGVDYLMPPRLSSDSDWSTPTSYLGRIYLSEEPVSDWVGFDPNILGVTGTLRSEDTNEVIAAEVRFTQGDLTTVAHEWGHALGLGHSPIPGNLMYPAAQGGGWDVTCEQLREVGAKCLR